MMHKAWSNIEEVPYCFLGSSVKLLGHMAKKNRRFWPELSVSGLKFEFTDGIKTMHKASCIIEDVPYCFPRSSVKFEGHTAQKTLILTQIGRFRTISPIWIHQWVRNDAQGLK